MGKAGKVVSGVLVAQSIYSEGASVFLDTKAKAKMTGKMLGCSLAMSYPFETQSITLVGFSLGT